MSERATGRAGTKAVSTPLMTEEEIRDLEESNPDGLTAKEAVQLFTSRGAKLSEATFRKYVQLGLLPRSRRVRRQGRRGGSLGLYPVGIVRRIVQIKALLAQDYTMDEIRREFLPATSEIDELEESLTRVFGRLEGTVAELRRTGENVEMLERELTDVRYAAESLTGALRDVERRLEGQARGQQKGSFRKVS